MGFGCGEGPAAGLLKAARLLAAREGKFNYKICMARCDEGYRCDVCGGDVEAIVDSDLYLRYVLGEVDPLKLPTMRERHIRCNPAMAQYIVDPKFDPSVCAGVFAKSEMDAEFVRQEEARITRGWRRLQDLPMLRLPITEYPLDEVRAKWAGINKSGDA